MSSTRIRQVYFNVNMGRQHDGLVEIARESQKKLPREDRLDPMKLPVGELLVFINTARDKLKVLAGRSGKEDTKPSLPVLAYVKLEGNRKLDLNTIQYIPLAFHGGRIDYDRALQEVIEAHLIKKASVDAITVYRSQE